MSLENLGQFLKVILGQVSIWGQEFLNFHLSTNIQRKEI